MNIILKLVLILVLVYIVFESNILGFKTTEGFSIEGEQNISSVYNSNNLSVENLNISGSLNILPKNSIVMCNSNTAPTGWAICDGTNGTPDLKGRMLLGLGLGDGLTARELGQIGGEEAHALTADEIPEHSHTSTVYNISGFLKSAELDGADCANPITGPIGSYKSTNPVGAGKPHNNMPPFMALNYIIKL